MGHLFPVCVKCAGVASLPQPTPRLVLVVDDDPVSLAIAALLLESEGCDVLQAESGEEAVELLAALNHKSELPHSILTDLRMPGLSGTELAQRLRRATPQALLLAMSASPPPAVEGFDGVIKKPLTPEALATVMAPRHMAPCSEAAAPYRHSDDLLDSKVFDRLRRAISPAALEEVVATFFHDTRTRIAAMRAADPDTRRREAHTVKGGAAMIGALRISLIAAAVESGIDDTEACSRKLDEMEAYCHRTEITLKQRLET